MYIKGCPKNKNKGCQQKKVKEITFCKRYL